MNKVFYFLTISLLAFGFISCNSKNSSDQQTISRDSAVLAENTPPMNYGDEGPVYIDRDGKEILRVLSEGEETLNLKDLTNDKIYNLKQVVSASGAKYEDENGFFFWSKGDEAFFGQNDTDIYTGLTLKDK